MQPHSHNSILPQHRTIREDRPVRVGLSDATALRGTPRCETVGRLIPDSTNPRAIEVICLCGQRLEIELLFPAHN